MKSKSSSLERKSHQHPKPTENTSRLSIIDKDNLHITAFDHALKNDNIILIKDISFDKAEDILEQIAGHYGLLESLKLQATFASIAEHRKNVGRYHMTVNERKNYEYITPHSEGDSNTNMQLASLYCTHNTTDGGENILFNVDSESSSWGKLKECKMKLKMKNFDEKKLTKQHIAFAKALFQIHLPEDLLRETDEIISEINIEDLDIELDEDLGIQLFNVLSKAKKTYSKILEKEVYPYWDSISGYDSSSGKEYQNILESDNLLKRPLGDNNSQMSASAMRWAWSSNVLFSEVFSSKITIKLKPEEFIIMNNLTWTHSTNNWSPRSGARNVVAAFA